jgi:hypothetical protein
MNLLNAMLIGEVDWDNNIRHCIKSLGCRTWHRPGVNLPKLPYGFYTTSKVVCLPISGTPLRRCGLSFRLRVFFYCPSVPSWSLQHAFRTFRTTCPTMLLCWSIRPSLPRSRRLSATFLLSSLRLLEMD